MVDTKQIKRKKDTTGSRFLKNKVSFLSEM